MTVEFEYLTVGGATCDRCGESRTGVRAAVDDARALLADAQVEVRLIERELSSERIADSNRVLVDGRPAEEWLGGSSVMTGCASCAELLGEPACCREVEVDGVRSEALAREVVLDAILAAAGLAPGAASGAGHRGRVAPVAVDLVTGAGCG